MNRIGQLGIFCIILGGVLLFLGLFPFTIGANETPGIGRLQIISILTGLSVLILGAYVLVYSLYHEGQPHSLMHSIALRLGMTGIVFAAGSTLADLMGFGSHINAEGPFFGWLQATGLLAGFLIASVGVLLYGLSRS